MSERRPDSDMDDDKTLVRQEPNDDKTNVRESSGASNAKADPAPRADANDATIIRDPGAGAGEKKPAEDSATIIREPASQRKGAPAGNATIIREPNPSNQSATILRGSRSGDSSTILRGSTADSSTILREPGRPERKSDDSTVMRDSDATVINAGHGDDSTVIAGGKPRGADTTYVASAGKYTQSRGNSEAGRLLKNRFVLEEKVGSGGMGDVYKALDLRQQEAQERNPYIAIKILNENFSRHKDAFISLQREATRTRGIPHPNIMAVYDFDREGDTVFMSMELLDGKPLDDYLKEHPEGVSVEDAWNIIDGICQGLSRAHGAGIVHSDFKPGNIYYTGDKIAKVFDFGIARAVSNPNDLQADGEKTVFDAGSLGALTPTYASYEMLTGQQPTKSDDVYAVALVAYELFTGRHPYNRTPADKALDRGLEPEPVPFLKRRHWRALKKGLALKAEDRFETIDEFYEGMFSEDPPYFRYAAIGAVLLISVGVGIYSYFKTNTVPVELTQLQGRISADKGNLKLRVGDPPQESLWKFTPDWQDDVRLSLARVRAVDVQLQEQWKQKPDPDVERWKDNVLTAYLTKIREIRKKGEDVKVDRGTDLKDQEVIVKGVMDDLTTAQGYLKVVQQYFNFDPDKISEEGTKLATDYQIRDFQHQTILADIKQAEDKAQRQAEERAREDAAAKDLEKRKNQYAADLDQFRDILRCKGDIADDDVAKLNTIINGPEGLKASLPDQFAVDKPGIVAALKGCIEQRIGVRVPKRARMIQAKVMAYLPGEPSLANIKIEDLDPCAARALEGSGGRNGNWCSDRLAVGGTGPDMVVVPKSPQVDHKFAIGRIEVKVSDYNIFCQATGCQKIPGPGTVPVTDITLEQAQAYARWLSDESGRTYRLPTPTEWEYAARTNEVEPVDPNVNCTVDSRGVRLGEKLQSALSGRPNHFGLYNFVGNAQEWAVTKDDKIYALGGAHTTPKSECDVILSEPLRKLAHSGKADNITGFRLLRQIDG